jgi:3-methyladenine DNA glycosylase AlkD
MQAYLKTDMPFYGVKRGIQKPLWREMKKRFAPESRARWEEGVRTLWKLPHREEKYFALQLAHQHKQWLTPDALPLFERLIREGAWWDLVDELATLCVGGVVANEPEATLQVMDRWIDDDDIWVRRAAVLSQLKRKDQTDEARLFRYCRDHLEEKEFWMRKAIGWALRQYAATAPEAVRDFLVTHREEMSGLTFREARRGVERLGYEVE